MTSSNEYRRDSNFCYLTDIEQKGTILVLMPGNETRKASLLPKRSSSKDQGSELSWKSKGGCPCPGEFERVGAGS
jgi:hypothetical protein